MENASKALIIAGAILLSILIIALGVFVFNQARGAMGNTGLTSQKAAAFNQQFQAYEGSRISGSQVKALIDLVNTNNNLMDENDDTQVNITLSGINKKSQVKNSKTYDVSFPDDGYSTKAGTKGYITKINISENAD